MYVYFVWPEISFNASSTLQGIRDPYVVILEVEWEENCCVPQVESLVPVYRKTEVLRLQTFLRDKFAVWASNGSCVEGIWNNFEQSV